MMRKKVTNIERIRMTQEGYNLELEKLEKLEAEFMDNEKAMTVAYKASSGDGAHDNGEFETLLNNERLLASQIELQKNKIRGIEIIEVEDLGEEMINIGDTVSIDMFFDNEPERMTITLVGSDGVFEENKISVNSPLGKAIYKAKVGDTVSYKVNKNSIMVDIVEKVNEIDNNYAKLK